MSCLECIFDVVVNDFVRLLGCYFPFNALPVPMLRQVFFRCSEVRFSLVFFLLLVKTQENRMSGSMFSHVFIDIFTPE